jgi:hypothetical protein
MATRTPSQYEDMYNKQANDWLRKSNYQLSKLEKGVYMNGTGLLTFMFDFAKYEINTGFTNQNVANNVLDYIIVNQK